MPNPTTTVDHRQQVDAHLQTVSEDSGTERARLAVGLAQVHASLAILERLDDIARLLGGAR